MATKINILTLLIIITNLLVSKGQGLPPACAGNREGYAVKGFEGSVFQWTVEGGTIVADWNDTIVVEWNSKGTKKIQVIEITPWNCIGEPVEAVVTVNKPDVNLNDQYAICAGDSLIIYPNTQYFTPLTYEWSNNSNNTYYIAKTEEKVWLKVTGTDGCSAVDTTSIIVHPIPVVYLGKDTSICGDGFIELNAGYHYSYLWSRGEIFNPIRVYQPAKLSDTIWVTVGNEFGCTASDTIVIYACSPEIIFKDIPNTITPNGDGQNDVWIIEQLKNYPAAEVEIYDRWGRLIYRVKSPDPMRVWDGRTQAGKELPMDSYYYIIDLKFPGMKPITGTINIVK